MAEIELRGATPANVPNPKGSKRAGLLTVEGIVKGILWQQGASRPFLDIDGFGTKGATTSKTFTNLAISGAGSENFRARVADTFGNALFASGDVGRIITITGAALGAHNDDFCIVEFINADLVEVSIDIEQPVGDTNNGTISGEVFDKDVDDFGTIRWGNSGVFFDVDSEFRLFRPHMEVNAGEFSTADLGIILRRNGAVDMAFAWIEADDEFHLASTSSRALQSNENIVIVDPQPLRLAYARLENRSTDPAHVAGFGSVYPKDTDLYFRTPDDEVVQITSGTGLAPASLAVSPATATGDTTETSLTDVLIDSMTVTPGAGTYTVWFASDMLHSANNEDTFFSLYANGVQVAASEIETQPDTGIRIPVSVIGQATVAAAQDIEIRVRTTSGTATIGNRTMIAIRN